MAEGGLNEGHGTIWAMTPPTGGNGWAFRILHVLNDPVGQCVATTDDGVSNPAWNTLLDKNGQILSFVTEGGYFDACGTSQTPIVGGLISVDPASGADAIGSNQFAAPGHASGPYSIESSPSMTGNTVFGTSQNYYDAGTDTYSPGVVFKITR